MIFRTCVTSPQESLVSAHSSVVLVVSGAAMLMTLDAQNNWMVKAKYISTTTWRFHACGCAQSTTRPTAKKNERFAGTFWFPLIFSRLRRGLSNGLFPPGFPANFFYESFIFPMPRPCHSPWFFHPLIWFQVQIMYPIIMQVTPLPCFSVLGPNISNSALFSGITWMHELWLVRWPPIQAVTTTNVDKRTF